MVPKPGSQCLVGRQEKGMDVKNKENNMECNVKDLVDKVKEVKVTAKEVEVCEKVVDPML